jgi:type II secretory pathway pseudopilin PulG
MRRQGTKYFSGFTLVEMVLSVAIFTLILGMTLPMLRTFTVRNDLDVATNSVVQSMRRAQTLSYVADGDTSWGIHVTVGSILIYKGVSYAARDQTYDEVTTMPTSITISGLSDVTFTKATGMPQSTGTLTLTSALNENRNITINQKGMVDY